MSKQVITMTHQRSIDGAFLDLWLVQVPLLLIY